MRARYWESLPDGRIQCNLCPRQCRLRDGARGFCFVRVRDGDELVLDTYGRSSGFCLDPIEKKPLNHFLPGTSVLSFGTAGCNLACKFCQNWSISKARANDALTDEASPADIVRAARAWQARSIAYTYNDPVIFAEYAIDVAATAREVGVANVAVTAGWVLSPAREEFFSAMDAANVDLKAFSDDFYRKLTGASIEPVKDTLRWLVTESDVWVEITTLVIPGLNDSDAELGALSAWVASELGPEVPLHFTAFHPDFRLPDVPRTPLATLTRARRIAQAEGVRHVYTGNVHNPEGERTSCATSDELLIERDAYSISRYRLTSEGRCPRCLSPLAGRFEAEAGRFGTRRIPVRIG